MSPSSHAEQSPTSSARARLSAIHPSAARTHLARTTDGDRPAAGCGRPARAARPAVPSRSSGMVEANVVAPAAGPPNRPPPAVRPTRPTGTARGGPSASP
jgi:hypothetical protein